jgi:hypothetical protein
MKRLLPARRERARSMAHEQERAMALILASRANMHKKESRIRASMKAHVTRNLDRIGLADEKIGRSGLTCRKDSGTIGPHVAQRVLRP